MGCGCVRSTKNAQRRHGGEYSLVVRPGKASQKRWTNLGLSGRHWAEHVQRARLLSLLLIQVGRPGHLPRKRPPALGYSSEKLLPPLPRPTPSPDFLAPKPLPGGALLCSQCLRGRCPDESQFPWDWSGTGPLLS